MVEDDLEALGMMRDVLSERWDVVTARSANDAVQKWELARPDAIVLDLRLGSGEDGVDVFHEIRRRIGTKPPTLVVSGADEARGAARALDVPVISKPFGISELVAAVAKLLLKGEGHPSAA